MAEPLPTSAAETRIHGKLLAMESDSRPARVKVMPVIKE